MSTVNVATKFNAQHMINDSALADGNESSVPSHLSAGKVDLHINGKDTATSTSAGDVSPLSPSSPNTDKPAQTDSGEGVVQAQKNKDGSIVKGSYLDYVSQLKEVWKDQPEVVVDLDQFSYTIPLPTNEKIPNIATAAAAPFITLGEIFLPKSMHGKTNDIALLPALDNVTATIKPSSMTLVLAPPGHGKSAFLKAISGQLYNKTKFLSGDIKWNGLTYDEAHKVGLNIHKLTAYVPQSDNHFSTLTVRETLQFALDNAVVTPPKEATPDLMAMHDKKVELVLQLLGLSECADTIVGNDLLRGISGGQKKRTTIGEMIISNARLLALDEITNGLDAAVAVDIVRSLREWCQISGGVVVTALQQPTPEAVDLFDNIILLRDGHVVYNGSRTNIVPYLEWLGAKKPAGIDDADFIIAYLSNPNKFCPVGKVQNSGGDMNRQQSDNTGLTIPQTVRQVTREQEVFSDSAADTSKVNAYSTDGMLQGWQSTKVYTQEQMDIQNRPQSNDTKTSVHPYTAMSYYRTTSHNFAYQFRSNLSRGGKLLARNPALIGPRIGQATFLGFLVGGLFYGLGTDSFSSIARVGLILSTLSVTPWANLNELPANDEAKPVVHKQLDSGFYSASAYVLAQTVLNLPLLIMESMILTIIIYWMGFFTADAGRFFFFFWCLFLNDAFFSIAFRTISYAAPNQFIAQQAGAPIVSGLISFAGFLITYRNIPDWLWEFYWISPFAWLARAMAISEFSASRYDTILTADANGVAAASSTGEPGRVGDIALAYWQMPSEAFYQWLAFAPLIFYYILGVLAVTYMVKNKRFDVQLGTKRPKKGSAEDLQLSQSSVRIKISRQESENSSASSVLPFVPVELVWRNIYYTVPIKDAADKTLLTDISAFCRPGECTALMGSSGAGKTTLMDVIAGRKTAGKLQGEILLNGQPKDDKVFQRITGYVEQNDLHMPLSTVREALLFSAKLRLPASVPAKKRIAFVDELLHLLELDAIQHRIIGNAEINGLSPAQTKLVTIGVELAANPSILFLDEPTSGIDSRAALVVMRVVRRIAATGRTVLCTIHQPSSELFFMFDRLVLLRTGGTMVYNGEVGDEGNNIVEYFETAASKDAEKRENELQNPASWMLEVLMRARDRNINYTEIWANNKMAAEAQRELEELAVKQGGTSLADRDTSRLNAFSEMVVVLGRQFKSYWRNIAYNMVRTMLCTILGIIYGLLYLNVASDVRNDHSYQSPTKLNSVLGGLLMVIAFMSALNCATALPVISGERAVYYREQASKTYHSLSYALALWIVEIPFTALALIGFCTPFYYLIGFLPDGIEFMKFFFMLVLCCWTINSMGHWLAAFSPNLIVASQLQGLLFTFVFQFGGVFIREQGPGAIKPGFNWIYYMNPVPKALNSIAMAQFGIVGAGDEPYPSGCASNNTCAQGYVTGTNGEPVTISYYLSNEYLGASPGTTYWSEQVGWIILTWIVFRILSILSLRFISYLKR